LPREEKIQRRAGELAAEDLVGDLVGVEPAMKL